MAQIEIGRGKTARRGYDLDEVSIVPSRRTRDADDLDTSWQLDAFTFDVPLVTIGSPTIAGALAVIDAEAHLGADGEFDAAGLAAAIGEVDDAGDVSAVAVRPQRAEQLLAALGRTEVDLLVVRGRVVSAEHVSRSREPLNLKKTVRQLEVPVIVGSCSSFQAALHLMRTGAAGVIVGSDPASRGVGVPLATAIADVRAARMQHLDETGVYVHLIAAVPVQSGGDVAKAIVCGADAVLAEGPGVGDPSVITDLRRTMATCGYESVKEFQSADLVVIA
ncbi:MAG: IMP dehydrogenase [Acidimicrobiales bacterium]